MKAFEAMLRVIPLRFFLRALDPCLRRDDAEWIENDEITQTIPQGHVTAVLAMTTYKIRKTAYCGSSGTM
jgi:hypothetical protein